MAQCKQNAQEFIQNTFSPMVAVLCSQDAESVCSKNNLTFVELIMPFCRLNAEAHIRDAGNVAHTIHNLRIIVRDFNDQPPQPTMARKLTNEVVAASYVGTENSPRGNVISIGDYDLQLSATTPWFEAYRECTMQVSYPSDHEFLKHFLACMFIVSSSHPDPMTEFMRLSMQQQQQMHQAPTKLPKWFSPNVLKYYVLIHDVVEGEESKAEAIYQSMKSTYGVNAHLLQINSQPITDALTPETKDNLPDPWSQFITKKVDNSQIYNLLSKDMSEMDPSMKTSADDVSFPTKLSEGTNSQTMPRSESMAELGIQEPVDSAVEAAEECKHAIDHPLAFTDTSEAEQRENSADAVMTNNIHSMDKTSSDSPSCSQRGAYLTVSDHDRLKIFIHEFAIRGLIPWAERMLRNLNDHIQSKKTVGRSFFSATKKWFGGNKPNERAIAHSSSIVYPSDSPEMQMRRLADLAFMFQMYEIAYQTYHAVKKDFNNEHAWMYLAGALEMASLSVFMQGNTTQRQYPHHYMETAMSTYQQTCKSPQFAARAALLSTEALKSRGMYTEAAMQFIKLTSEDSDLRSALLLEQAAHCFIKMKTPMVRKYAFHMILSGHRFSKACQRKHSLRAYSQALQVYKGKNWTLAEDHINFTIGRQSFNLKQLDNATSALRHILGRESQQTAAQQNAFLKEYLFVYKQQLSQAANEGIMLNGILPPLPLPTIELNSLKILLCKPQEVIQDNKVPATAVNFTDNESDSQQWEDLEESVVRHKYGGSVPLSFSPSIQCYTEKTDNGSNPKAVVGEVITVEVVLNNPLKIPLVLTEVLLLWSYAAENSADKPNHVVTNEVDTIKNTVAEELVHTVIVEEIVLQGNEHRKVHLCLIPRQTGELHITGIAYNLGTSSQNIPFSTTTSAQDILKKPSFISTIYVRGKQNLEVQGPRLNGNKQEKAGKLYGPDRRLDLRIVPSMPLLQVNFYDFPQTVLCGEVQKVTVELINQGPLPLINLKVASSTPNYFTFGTSQNPADRSVLYPTIPESGINEFIAGEQRVGLVCEVPIRNGKLDPGQSASVPMWIRGETTPGVQDVNFLFCYESADNKSQMSHRVLRHQAAIIVSDSLSLKATAFRGTGHGFLSKVEKELTDITLSLEIQSNEKIHNSSAMEFSVLQVSCASKHWTLDHLSTSRNTDIKVNCGEAMLLCLKGCKCMKKLQDCDRQVVFSNVPYDQHMIHSAATPCSDFYFRSLPTKPPDHSSIPRNQSEQSLRFPTIVENSLEGLEKTLNVGLTVIILWKGFVFDENGVSQVIMGQHNLTIDKLDTTVCTNPPTKLPLESGPLKIIKEPEDDSLENQSKKEILEKLLNVTLNYSEDVSHDFQENRICYVPVDLILHNCSQSRVKIVINTKLPSEENEQSNTTKELLNFLWCGQSSRKLELNNSESKTLKFRASFCKPGIYNLSRLQILAAVLPQNSESERTQNMVCQRTIVPSLITVNNL